MMVNAPVGAIAGPTLVGAAVWGEVPVRSTVIASPATVTRARMLSGSSRVASALEVRLVGVLAVGQGADRAPHAQLGAVHQLHHRGPDHRGAVARGEGLHPLGRLAAGADHGVEVALALARPAHVVEDEIERGLVGHAAVHDADGRDADAFLEDLGGVAGEAARAHAAHVAPVRAHHREDEEPPVREERIDHGHVVQVGAAGIGVVVQEDVARVDVVAELLLHRLHRPADRHDVERVVLALGHRDELGVAVHEHAGEVLALVEDRGVGGAHQGHAHLAHDRGEGLAQDLQRDRVHRGGAHARASRSNRRLPWASIAPCQPGGTTVVAPNSSTMAGP